MTPAEEELNTKLIYLWGACASYGVITLGLIYFILLQLKTFKLGIFEYIFN